MPFIQVKTSAPVSEQSEETIQTLLGQAVTSLPGKTEQWLMVGFEPEYRLWFQGTDEPAAMVEVSVYGGSSPDRYDELTGRICDILAGELDLDPARIYVKYSETPDWGWNGANF